MWPILNRPSRVSPLAQLRKIDNQCKSFVIDSVSHARPSHARVWDRDGVPYYGLRQVTTFGGKLMFEEGLDLFSVFDRVPRRGLLATEHYSNMGFRPTSTLGLLQL